MSQTRGNSGNGPDIELDVTKIFDGKRILLIGTTGFVGKVALSMLLCRYPNVGRVYCLVRPGAGNTADERFFRKVATSPAFDPLRELWGDGYESFLREKIVAIPGDIGRPLCNFDDAMFERFASDGGLDVVVNSAGLVSFTPSLESALRINARGAANVLEVAKRANARLVHVSTCYVCGRRDGEVWEDEPVVGYFPRQGELLDEDFDAHAEMDDCQRIIDQVRDRANDRAHISQFREQAAAALESQRRDPDDPAALRLAVARERKIWMATRLTELGQQRAEHWGWTNTYTYTKSLGEQAILGEDSVVSTIVRPAIVESSVRFPFPGWNEGFNTTAPLVYLVLKGHRHIVASDKKLDVVPVDYVAAGMIMATAAVLVGEHDRVYQLGTSGINPVTSKRLTEMTALAVRRLHRHNADEGHEPVQNRIRARLESMPVDYQTYKRRSAPLFGGLAKWASREIDRRVPRWGAPKLQALSERAKDELGKVIDFTDKVDVLIEMFKPFNFDHDIAFRCDNVRRLHQRLSPSDQQRLPFDPETIDWRYYWMETHFPGLQQWVFPVLDDEFGAKPRTVYTYKDLLELFDAATKLHKHRVALRMLPTSDDDAEPVVYTYERVQELAAQGAAALRERGIGPGDSVLLMSENRPEWGIGYFAVLKTGATVAPVDSQLSLAEVENVVRASAAKICIVSTKVAERLLEDESEATTADAIIALDRRLADTSVVGFAQLLVEPAVSPAAVMPPRRSDAVASLIFTSGTTGSPKGVMLTHKNFTAMAAKLSSLFKLYRHDGLLSVLPLHHTLEFSAGFLMPLVHGASITYLEEVGADGLQKAFDEGTVTGMVGVPALWQLLSRKIWSRISDRGPLVERAFETIVELNRSLRDRVPYGANLGRLLFLPVHQKLGGRMRLMISGGSALPVDVMKSFQGLGFRLFEGYGMTEASPVITVHRPSDRVLPGSVGRALPGIDVAVHEPDERGVGEVIAKGPNVMKGYHEDPEATRAVLRNGWLHTGDLGRLDDEGNLFIVGRKKEMILGASGENIYPDELEDVYGDTPDIKELSIVGLPQSGGGETVAALVVPDYEASGDREAVRERVREHLRVVSRQLPLYKRIKVYHLWDHDLPKTATRKVKRREVVGELERLERAAAHGTAARQASAARQEGAPRGGDWIHEIIAQVAQKKRSEVAGQTRLEELGFDSLMFTELAAALDAAGIELPDPGELAGMELVADVVRFVESAGKKTARLQHAPRREDDSDEIVVPRALVRVGRRLLALGQHLTYERVFHSTVRGRPHVPPFGGYIVAANHASHLDMGLVKHALGESGDMVRALAAKDYFFDDPVRRAYFENFTNLVPMERYGSLRESLRMAGEVITGGDILLIFPEGTRQADGVMRDFKPSLGYLSMHNRCGILPIYLAGTHDAMPKGSYLPKERELAAHVGPFLTYEALRDIAAGKPRSEGYRAIATEVEREVRRLCPPAFVDNLGPSGREPLAEHTPVAELAAEETPQPPSAEPLRQPRTSGVSS